MPRGVPKAGFRKTKKALKEQRPVPKLVVSNESDEQIDARISERFDILKDMSDAAFDGVVRSLIVSGPAGLGKSFTVEQSKDENDPEEHRHTVVKGYVKPTGLYKTLYQNRHKGNVVIFDDADSIFFDDVSLNFLKAVCDTTDVRKVSYLADYNLGVDEDTAELIPNSFIFEGSIVFITNLDFDHMIDKNHKLTPHLKALVSRSHYIDLTLKSQRDYLVRIKQVISPMMKARGIAKEVEKDIIDFIETEANNLRELSLRMVVKIADIRLTSKRNWKGVARITCCRAK